MNNTTNNLTSGNLLAGMRRYAIPYLIACFLQTFYGMADLFVTGQFHGADVVTAVSIGSQVTHMLTVIIVGLAMGTTVCISRAVGASKKREVEKYIGNSVTIFSIVAVVVSVLLLLSVGEILEILSTPEEARLQAHNYLMVCFTGLPFIIAYNVICSIFRGLGDTKRPMLFVGIAGIINIILDYLFIGVFGMSASGAALATVIAQVVSVVLALCSMRKDFKGVSIQKSDFRLKKEFVWNLLKVGVPISCQDGLIQISFILITVIANQKGVHVAAAVGVVEKIISFLFLVPSAMLSTISAVAAQNIGAKKMGRAEKVLFYGLRICMCYGLVVILIGQMFTRQIIAPFVRNEPEVLRFGAQYFRAYVVDCFFAGIHFCYSGYFSACGKAHYSFIHNIVSIVIIRVPFAYLASEIFSQTLFPMGLAAPLGSILSNIICIILYRHIEIQRK